MTVPEYIEHDPDLVAAAQEFKRRLDHYASEARTADNLPPDAMKYWTRCAQALVEEYDYTIGKAMLGQTFQSAKQET